MDKRKALIAVNLMLAGASTSLIGYMGYRPRQPAAEVEKFHASPERLAPETAPFLPAKTAPPEPAYAARAPESAENRSPASARDSLVQVIRRRVSQEKPKMKLTPEEGRLAESYAGSLASMPNCSRLAVLMPKTAVEILRAVHERGVLMEEGEKMSDYLVRMHSSLKMENPGPFDENTSHVIGRHWHEIDYSGEGMSWQSQKAFYERHGIPDLRTAGNLRKMFELESKLPYFKKIYRPAGALPE